MGRDIVSELASEIVKANALNFVKAFFGLVHLDFERVVNLNEGEGSFGVLQKCGISYTRFIELRSLVISNCVLKLEKRSFEDAPALQLAESERRARLELFLELEPFCLCVSIAVENFSIFNPKAMQHALAFKPVVSL